MKIERTMSLAEAFRIRNLLKAKQNKLSSLYAHSSKTWRKDIEQKDEATFGRSAYELLHATYNTIDVLGRFNLEINKANFESGAQAINLRINNVKDKLMLYDIAVNDVKKFKSVDFQTNFTTGEQMKIEYVVRLDVGHVTDMVQKLSDERFELELKLSEINAMHKFTIDEQLAADIKAILDEITG